MGRRYGHWRMRQLRAYPSRLRIREFMPWFGLIATLTCLLVSEVYSSSLFTSISLGLIGTYVSILTLVGLIEQAKKPLFFGMIPGFFICLVVVSLFLLHVSFSFGLLTGFLGLKSPTNERVMGTNNSSNRGVE